jgi:hypothetical protein
MALSRCAAIANFRAKLANAPHRSSVTSKKLRIFSENRDGACLAERFFFYSAT